MPRLSHVFRLATLLVLAVAVLGIPAWAEDEAEAESKPSVSFRNDLDAKTQKTMASLAAGYFDPEVEFLWRPRKNFLEGIASLEADQGVNALVDIEFLREIVYQGRHFLARFTDKKWQRDNEITEFKKTDGLYNNLISERYRFSYTIPKSYPKERDFTKIPRPEALPLLLSIHEEQDSREKYPGGSVLKRRYPKGDFGDLYDNWLTVAPVAARAKFLEDDAIRHRFLTGVLTNFWRRYNVDFDRIIVDGTGPAAAMAAAFPHVFAGVVLRPGKSMKFEPEVVRNYATLPVFVVGDKDLAKKLEEAGHPNVTIGSDEEVVAWMSKQRRQTPKSFSWAMLRPDHASANWLVVTGPDFAAPERTMKVEVLDTEADPNTIKVAARGIEHLRIFLSDEIVDLDRDVRLLINGEEKVYAKTPRDFGRLFEKDPEVRRNMNFGWLYTMLLEDIRVPEEVVEEKPAEAPTEAPPEEGPKGSDEDEAKAAKLWAKAEGLEAEGNADRAVRYYVKIVEIGETSYLARAKAKVQELE